MELKQPTVYNYIMNHSNGRKMSETYFQRQFWGLLHIHNDKDLEPKHCESLFNSSKIHFTVIIESIKIIECNYAIKQTGFLI